MFNRTLHAVEVQAIDAEARTKRLSCRLDGAPLRESCRARLTLESQPQSRMSRLWVMLLWGYMNKSWLFRTFLLPSWKY